MEITVFSLNQGFILKEKLPKIVKKGCDTILHHTYEVRGSMSSEFASVNGKDYPCYSWMEGPKEVRSDNRLKVSLGPEFDEVVKAADSSIFALLCTLGTLLSENGHDS